MREIKFRAWDIAKCEYVPWEGMYGLTQAVEPPGVAVHLAIADHCYLAPEECVIEQYTGLKDKNGMEIYEGDIIERSMGASVVKWGMSQTRFGWNMPLVKEDWAYGFNCVALSCDGNKLEIIGNIHENQDLLCSK